MHYNTLWERNYLAWQFNELDYMKLMCDVLNTEPGESKWILWISNLCDYVCILIWPTLNQTDCLDKFGPQWTTFDKFGPQLRSSLLFHKNLYNTLKHFISSTIRNININVIILYTSLCSNEPLCVSLLYFCKFYLLHQHLTWSILDQYHLK